MTAVVDQIPPNNLEAEMALLGSIMVDRHMMDVVVDIVQPGDLYAALHEAIFTALRGLHAKGFPLDKVSLAEELRARGMLDTVGGVSYLTSLMDAVPTGASTEYYAKIVREKAALRGLIFAGNKIVRLGYEGEDDAEAALAEAEKAISAVVLHSAPIAHVESSATALDRLANAVREHRHEAAIFTPWAQVNQLTGGFLGGELIVVPAAPASGKSGFVQCICEYNALRRPVLLAAAEMGEDATHRRRIAQRSNVSARVQRLGTMDDVQRQRIYAAVNELRNQRLYVVGEHHITIASLWRAAREIVKIEGSIALIAVDQMGWLDDVNRDVKGTTRHDRKSAAFLDLIKLGKAFGCPIIAVDHLNREGMKERPSIRTLRQIRDGGNAEGHAHHVIFPHRDDPDEDPTKAAAIIAKSRDGGTGTVPMFFDGARSLWLEVSGGEPVPAWFEAAAAVDESTFDFDAPFDDSADQLKSTDIPFS